MIPDFLNIFDEIIIYMIVKIQRDKLLSSLRFYNPFKLLTLLELPERYLIVRFFDKNERSST